MKKEEKTRLTCEKIIQAAIAEFGTKSYEAASLNTICSDNHISKGLIYHNFKNKDELYLICVKQCYEEMTRHIKNTVCHSESVEEKLKELLSARQVFFEKNPYYAQIFFNSVLMPPRHLIKELKELRVGYDECLKERYAELLFQMELRKGVSVEKAIQYLMTMQEMYNGYFREMYYENEDIQKVIETHESRLSELLDMIMYGIAKKTEDFSENLR